MIQEHHYERAFKGFVPFDAAVIDRDTFVFVLFKDEPKDKGKRRLVSYSRAGDGSVDGTNYTGFPFPSVAISRRDGNQAVMVSMEGEVAVLGGGEDGLQKPIPKSDSGPIASTVKSVVEIDGVVYVCGGWRQVCYRTTKLEWTSIRGNLPDPTQKTVNHCGFDSISGFNSNDIYCVGGKGDAWRYDGKKWHRCPVPTNMYLESVCCAGDGNVYIGMQSGCLMRGRENRWEVIHEDTMTLPFKDMVWFDNRLWCTSDYGLWTVENGKLVDADVPPEVKACSGNLSAADGVMLLAGHYGAAVYDGTSWDRLF
jgi:hypothetical protein